MSPQSRARFGAVLGVILASLALFPLSGSATPIVFGHHAEYSTGRFPIRLTLADVNHDGRPDIVTSDSNSNPREMSVLLNIGNGTFGMATPYPISEVTRSPAAGDVDGDGDIDLVAGLQSGELRVALLLNDGTGHFGPPELFGAIQGRPDAVAVIDLDGDGDRDILLAQAEGDEIVVLKNQGDGSFSAPTSYGGLSDAYFIHMSVGDVDGDGDADVAIGRSLSSTPPSLYRNRGDGTFEPRQTITGNMFSYAGNDLGDLDGDGDLDFVMVSEAGSLVLALRNDGSGSFSSMGYFPAGVETQLGSSVTLADLDGDGLADVTVPGANTYRVATLRSNGMGFEAAEFHELGGLATDVAAASLDGDQDLDLVSALPHQDQVSVLINLSETTAVGAAFAEAVPSLGPALSNPASLHGTSIPYVLAVPAEIRISVRDAAGRHVRTLFRGARAAGRHVVAWDGRGEDGTRVSAGVYLVELNAGGWRGATRVTVIP